ncbi:MAG: YecA family protein, partial [Arenicella sp.]|nr:YecA family protein [Arenicella sp.]
TIAGAIANHLKSGISPDLLKLLDPEAQHGQYGQLQETLQEIYRDTSDSLFASDDSFDLVLPDEDEALEIRVEGLASWTRGYLLGLLHNNAFGIDQLPESGAEIARDMMQIAEASAGADAEREEDWALGELHEYIKVGAQLIFEFIYSERSGKAAPLSH